MNKVYVVTYVGSGMIALPYAYTKKEDAEKALASLSTSDTKIRVRELEVK